MLDPMETSTHDHHHIFSSNSCAESHLAAPAPTNSGSKLSGDEEFEEELAVLPRHTKVVVTGNNRTKSMLVGLHGVVKKAVGLGGWHWLVLTNGLEVKLQRNALSVVEAPTGLEEDDDGSEQFSGRSNTCAEEIGKPFRHKVRLPKPTATTTSKGGSRTAAVKEKVDFNKLEMDSLQRYWRHFRLQCELGPNPSKEQLIDAIERHFMSQQLDETQVITNFMQAAKRLKTVCG